MKETTRIIMYISNINSASIKLKRIKAEEYDVDEKVTLYSDDELLIYYINQGAVHFDDQGKDREVKKNQILILNPGEKVVLTVTRKTFWQKLYLNGVLFTSSLAIDSTKNVFIVTDDDADIKRYIDLVDHEYHSQDTGSDLILKKLIEIIFVHILRNNTLSIKDAAVQMKNDGIAKIQRYIRNNYGERITLDSLSEIIGINKYYMIRLFKQKTGLSPIDYLIHIRLAKAEQLLVQSETTISQIADIVGFHSPSHFSKTFKESNQMTPSDYRKKYRKKNNS
ncbi:helix-turn-helix domain-containing protein [Hutsoniella sourekii]|uniref:helix-turn-helix domain-containing protein n=1 Tax=Hutsoniella sourekii TaxID=87650 RepID=UPI0004BCDBD0|nr:AraC family transcriptional regulator [Hutsoniella sourekii]